MNLCIFSGASACGGEALASAESHPRGPTPAERGHALSGIQVSRICIIHDIVPPDVQVGARGDRVGGRGGLLHGGAGGDLASRGHQGGRTPAPTRPTHLGTRRTKEVPESTKGVSKRLYVKPLVRKMYKVHLKSFPVSCYFAGNRLL